MPPKSAYTDAVIRLIKAMQTQDGNWAMNESRRPPVNAGEFQTAALAIYSLKHFGQAAEKASTDIVLARALNWLENAKPSDTQDYAFRLLALAWGNDLGGIDQRAAARWSPSSERMADGINCPECCLGCLRHGASTLCFERCRENGGDRSGIPERRGLSAAFTGRRWIVAC